VSGVVCDVLEVQANSDEAAQSDDIRFHPSLYYSKIETEAPAMVCAIMRDQRLVGVTANCINQKVIQRLMGWWRSPWLLDQ
jgi:hypothetical protein